jgi:hypothetical protein
LNDFGAGTKGVSESGADDGAVFSVFVEVYGVCASFGPSPVTEVKGFLRLETLLREDLGFCVFDNTVDCSFSSEGQRFDHLGERLGRKIRRCCLRRNVFNTGGGTPDLANFLLVTTSTAP